MFFQQEKKFKENKNLFWTFWGYLERKVVFYTRVLLYMRSILT